MTFQFVNSNTLGLSQTLRCKDNWPELIGCTWAKWAYSVILTSWHFSLHISICVKFVFDIPGISISIIIFQVVEDSAELLEELQEGDWYIVKDPEYPHTEEDRDKAVRRAEDRLAEKKYSLLFNNCEHFVTEVLKPGRGESEQVNNGSCGSGKSSSSGKYSGRGSSSASVKIPGFS